MNSRKTAAAMLTKFVKQLDEIRAKPKLTAADLKELRRLRELAQLYRALGV